MNILLFFLGLLGSAVVLLLAQSCRRSCITDDTVFTAMAMAVLLMGTVSLFSVRLGMFSLPFVSLGSLLAAFFLLLTKFLSVDEGEVVYQPSQLFSFSVVFVLLLLCVGLYGLFPTYYMQGGRDPGLYLLFSHHINQTGGLNLDLPWMRELHEKYGDAVRLGYPGIYSAFQYGLSDDPGSLIPQFMHLFPAYGAIGAALAGIDGIVRTNTVIVFFALWSFYMVARRFMAAWGALLATLLLMINPALLWVGRSTFTEPLHIFIFFFGLYLFFKAIDLRSTRWAGVAGFVIGLSVLNRLSGALGVAVIGGGVIYAVVVQAELRKIATGFVGGYLLASTIGFLDGYFNSYPYFYDLWHAGVTSKLLLLNYGVAIGSLILIKINLSEQTRGYIVGILERMVLPLICLLMGWIFIRYQLSFGKNADFNLRSARELTWYLTCPAIFFALLSLVYAKKEKNRLFILTVGPIMVATLFIYTWRPSITPDHYWASRRWVAFCIPLILLCFVKTLTVFYDFLQKKKLPSCAAVLVLAVPVCWYIAHAVMLSSPFLFVSLLKSYPAGYATVAKNIKKLKNNRMYFTRDIQAAGYLTYMYGIPTVLLTNSGVRQIRQGMFSDQPSLGLGINLSDVYEVAGEDRYRFCGEYTERVRGSRPSKLVRHCRKLTPGVIISPDTCRILPLRADSVYFGTRVGKRNYTEGTLASDGTAGTLEFGPYISTGAGKYRVRWRGEVLHAKNTLIGSVDVTVDKGTKIIKSQQVMHNGAKKKSDVLAQLDFEIGQPVSGLEYRFRVAEGAQVVLSSIELTCVDKEEQ